MAFVQGLFKYPLEDSSKKKDKKQTNKQQPQNKKTNKSPNHITVLTVTIVLMQLNYQWHETAHQWCTQTSLNEDDYMSGKLWQIIHHPYKQWSEISPWKRY